MIDWTQISIGVAALLVMYMLLRFAIGALITSLTSPIRELVTEVRSIRTDVARLETRLVRLIDPPAAAPRDDPIEARELELAPTARIG